MRLLLLLILLIPLKVQSQEILTFFDKELGSRIVSENLITLKSLETIKSKEEAEAIHNKITSLEFYDSFLIPYSPENINKDFNEYFVQISPHTGTIFEIIALGEEIPKEKCEGKILAYLKYFEDKYKSHNLTKNKTKKHIFIGYRNVQTGLAFNIVFYCSFTMREYDKRNSYISIMHNENIWSYEKDKLISKILAIKDDLLINKNKIDTTGL